MKLFVFIVAPGISLKNLCKDFVEKMCDDLNELNNSGSMTCAPEVLERTWSKDMCWFGPCGIGASYTIPRYQRQHQLPFR